KKVLDDARAEAFGLARGALTLMLHTGSRALGHGVGTDFIQAAISQNRGRPTSVADVYALDAASETGQSYLAAMNAAANYAFVNRFMVGVLVMMVLKEFFPAVEDTMVYDLSHNLVQAEQHDGQDLFVHRKGATKAVPASLAGGLYAGTGQPLLIPGSMGTLSYVLAALEGSAQTLHSVNHGAGRVLTRKQAMSSREGDMSDTRGGGFRKRHLIISDQEFAHSMRGVAGQFADRRAIKTEAPQVYKDIDTVIKVVNKSNLAAPVAQLKPIGVVKE
ncbi:MAG: RtcB family protein, partial [Deltaproteobacteria bacterium]|nr:RtcB family protein [Deltaproteobacteria bacterium]